MAVVGGAVAPPCRRWTTPGEEVPACAEQRCRQRALCVCENTSFCQAGFVHVRSHGVCDKFYLPFCAEEVE